MGLASVKWAVVGLLAVVCAAPAFAQADIPSRLSEDLEVTQHLLDSAEVVASRRPDAPEVRELDLARDLQARARRAAARGRPLLAKRATMDARQHAERAIAISRGLPDPERVMVQLERTSELVERAGERLAGCSEGRALALVRAAAGVQARAVAAGDEGRFLAALQLTLNARQRVEKAMRLCHVVEDLAETVTRGLRRTDDALDQARRVVAEGAPPQARHELGRAMRIQDEARVERDAQHLERALQLTQLARGIANRVARRQPPPGGPPPPPPPRPRD